MLLMQHKSSVAWGIICSKCKGKCSEMVWVSEENGWQKSGGKGGRELWVRAKAIINKTKNYYYSRHIIVVEWSAAAGAKGERAAGLVGWSWDSLIHKAIRSGGQGSVPCWSSRGSMGRWMTLLISWVTKERQQHFFNYTFLRITNYLMETKSSITLYQYHEHGHN